MRDRNVFNVARAMPRMSWSPQNLYLLWMRTIGPRKSEIDFRETTRQLTLFAQRWRSKALVRAYHGDVIPEKIFKRWYLPETLPDVRPKRAVMRGNSDDKQELEAFARRKTISKAYAEEESEKGMAPVGSLMFREVERRIDTVVFRSCFAHSVYEARRLVTHGYVKLNGKLHQDANTRLAPGDMISVEPSAIRFLKSKVNKSKYQDVLEDTSKENDAWSWNKSMMALQGLKLTPFHLPYYSAPFLFVPAYIETNFKTCSAIYVRHPTARPGYSEIPTPYDADGDVIRFAWEWYVLRRPRIRSKTQLARMPLDRDFKYDRSELQTILAKQKEKARKEKLRGMIL